MSAVDLENMSRYELCQYCFDVHGHKPPKKTKTEPLKALIRSLNDTLENPLQVGEEVRYLDEKDTCTIASLDSDNLFSITDSNSALFNEIQRFELTRVNTPPPKELETEIVTEIQENSTLKATPEAEEALANEQRKTFPHEINESSYRPKPGAIVIGGLPDNGSSNTRKTGVTHVLNDKVEASKTA